MTVAGTPTRAASVPAAVGQGGRRQRTSSQSTPLLLSKKAKNLLNAHAATAKRREDSCEALPTRATSGIPTRATSGIPTRVTSGIAAAPQQKVGTEQPEAKSRRRTVTIDEGGVPVRDVSDEVSSSVPKRQRSAPPARFRRAGSMNEDPSAPRRRMTTSAGEAMDKPTGPESFEILSTLGKGSFGAVYKVEDKRSNEVFAMKILQKDHVFQKNLVRYTLTEKNVMAQSNHAFIVNLHYAFQTPSALVLIQQFCPNGSLEGLLKKEGTLPEDLAQLYTLEIFLAIEHLHAKKIIYRDMKPANVVLDDTNHAMLTDFGLSKQGVEGLKGTRSFCGSCAYLAPEVLSREGHGSPVDIYGLGVLLFEMLTGKPPYIADNKEQLFKNIKGAELQLPPSASKNCVAFLGSVMQREPSQRLGARHTPDLRGAPFLSALDIEQVLQRKIPVPPLKGDRKPGTLIGALIARGSRSASSNTGSQEKSPGKAPEIAPDTTAPSPFAKDEKAAQRKGSTWRTPQRQIQGWDYSDDPEQEEPQRRCCLLNLFRWRRS